MFDFVCKKYGEIQKSQKEGKKNNSFGMTCQKRRGELEIQIRKQERANK